MPVLLFLVWSAMRLRPWLFADRAAADPQTALEAAHGH